MWTEHSDFLPFVQSAWSSMSGVVAGPPLCVLHQKLKLLKADWNWHTFGDLRQQIAQAEDNVEKCDVALQSDFTTDNLNAFCAAQQQLDTALHREDLLLKDKARDQWLRDGDRNSSYFHAAIKVRRQRKTFHLLKDDGTYVSDPIKIGEAAVEHFHDLFLNSYRSSPT